ncbi:MAG: F0F1 ATP synthase subunit gamma [Burkholderiaceae bacterium]
MKSVQNTRKITKAMEMVSVSKMRKAQERMQRSRPYGDKVRNIAAHLATANPEFRHPFLVDYENIKAAGLIVVTTDKGLCGGLNTNVLRLAMQKLQELTDDGEKILTTAIGSKGFGFLNRMGVNIVSHVTQLGDTPHLETLIGAVKVQLDAYAAGEIDQVFLVYTRFLNTMKQEPVMERLLPLDPSRLQVEDKHEFGWDYLYEPDAESVLNELMTRYVEGLIYQAVAENMASEHSARMVAMKAASDNANTLIDELRLTYNKARQAAITQELSEIVGGAAAV